MVIIQGLEKSPKRIKKVDYMGREFGCQCPCYHEASQDGPAYCSILVLIKGYFNASPDNYECPLKEINIKRKG